jgi:hypothetical protein
MTFDDIGRVWREEPSGAIKRRRVEDLSDVMGRADSFLGRQHRNGRRILVLTAVLVVPVFTWGVINAPRPMLALPGSLMIGLWLALMSLRWRNLRPPSPDATQPVRIAVEAEVARLRFLERFWGDAPWAMIALFLAGEILAFEGFRSPDGERTMVSVVFYVMLIGIIAVSVFRNPVLARRRVRPLREDLESWLEGLQALEREGSSQPNIEGGAA